MESSDSESLPPDRPSSLQICSYEEYKANDIKARQRASILWLVSKACENTLPNDLKDPYYRDHEDQDRLKPMIIQGLSTAALYCSALANIYADPNYHSLNHHGILQVLMRKGVHVEEPTDMPLTETVLAQTAPIRMSAHMAVIEGIMALFIKEVLIPEKVVEVVSRFSMVEAAHEIPSDAEEAAVLWINKSCVKLQHRIEEEMGSFHSPEESDPRQVSHQRSPNVPIIQDLADLSDGCSLAAVLSFYCPDFLPWQEISFNEPVSLADSLYNLQLVQRFCEEQLPHDICFLTLEDFLYMHDTIKQSALAFLADLMFLFEIRPARCVVRPGVKEDTEPVKQGSAFEAAHRRHSHNGRDHRLRSFQQAVSPIPDLRSGGSVSSYGGSSFSLPDIHRISPRSNGPIPVREKTIERSPSARKMRGYEGSKSPISPTSSLRRTNSVNLPDSDRRRSKSYPDTVAAGLPSKANHEEVRQKSDEDEEIAAYFTNRDTSLPFDANPSSQARRELFPADGQVPGNGREGLEPLRPAYIKQSKERSNHDTKVQERGEDRRNSGLNPIGSKEAGSPPEGYKIPEVIQRRKEVEDEYGSIPSEKPNPILSEGNSRLSTGLADYYQQLAEETHAEDLLSKSAGGSPAKPTTWQKDIMMAKLAEFTEKAALENVDPYSSNLATTSFAQLSKLREGNPNPAINIVYMQHDKEGRYPDGGISGEAVTLSGGTSNPTKALKSSFLQKSRIDRSQVEDRHTSFATLPNTTTWQQQSGIRNRESSQNDDNPDSTDSQPLAAQLNDIRLQLEERRRKIEQEKRRMETMLKKQRQKLGKAAFLQAVSKPGTAQTPADGDSPIDNSERLISPKETSANGILPPQSNSGQVSIKDIENDIDSVTRKWLKPGAMGGVVSPDQTSPLEDSVSDDVINTEDFQNSIEQLNSSLSDLQADISRLSQRQYSIQDLAPSKRIEEPIVTHSEHPQQNFFLHKSASGHNPGELRESVYQGQRQQQLQQQQPFVPSPRRGQWQPETPPNQIISNMYSQSPHQQVINTNTSPRRGQWGQPLPSHMTPDQYQIPWQPPHPMRPASVDPQHMMHGHQIHHPAYDHRSPSAVPFMDSRNPGYPIHGGPQHDGYGYQYPHHPTGMYQNGPLPNQYDYNRGYGAGGNMPPQPPIGHYDPMGNYPVMSYPGAQHSQLTGPAPHQQSFRLGQENQMNSPYQVPPQNQIQQQASNFQPIVPEREMNYREESNQSQQQSTSTVDDFGRPVRTSLSPERSPPSPPSKPMIGRTFRIPKGKTGGISPTKESASPPRNVPDTEIEEADLSQSPPKNGLGKGGDGTDNTHFYISFDNDQPKKPKPKKPMRPREVKALSAASKVNGKQGSNQDQGGSDGGSDERKSPPLPTSFSGGSINTQSSGDSSSDGRPQPPPRTRTQSVDESGVGFFIGADLVNPDPEAECEMQKKKELIMMLSLRRRAEQESQRLTKEQEYAMQREQERQKQEDKDRKKEDERLRRQQILDNYRMRRQQEELEKDGGGPADIGSSSSRGHGGSRPGTLTKSKQRSTSATRPRPKSVHVTTHTREPTPLSSLDTLSRGSHLSLAGLDYQDDKDSLFSVGSGGTLTHRTLSPQSENSGPSRQLTSPTSSGGGGSRGPYLPPGFVPSHHRTGPPSDGASDAGSTTSSAFTDYTGPKLFVKPAAKSNRGIILNAINTVLAGSVNSETKRKVLEEINRSESKHFLILFRDSGCQFRAMYSYNPDKEEVIKLFGIGPKVITAKMMDRFYKYNSGGKCFSEVQTKHLTVTIDAITIQNHLWSGKRAMAQKKDLF